MKVRLLSAIFALGIIIGGAGAIAKSGADLTRGTSKQSSAKSQYCPPSSPQPGKPKKPGPARCGKGPKSKGHKAKGQKCKAHKRKGRSRKGGKRKAAKCKNGKRKADKRKVQPVMPEARGAPRGVLDGRLTALLHSPFAASRAGSREGSGFAAD